MINNITVHIYSSSTQYYDITGLLKTVKLSGDINTLPRQISVEFVNANDSSSDKILVSYDVGNFTLVFVDGEEVFRGNIFKTTIDQDGNASFTAYDELVYLTKNSDSILVKKQKASDIVRSLSSKFGIDFSSIEDTGYVITKLACQDQALSDIFKNCFDETKVHNGKSFWIYSRKGKAFLVSRGNSSELIMGTDEVLSASREVSIEDTRTQVVITKGTLDPQSKDDKPFVKYTATDSDSRNRYGIMQHIESVDDTATDADARAKANELISQLKEPATTMKMDFPGNTKCVTGNRMSVHDGISGIIGTFYITSDEHNWDSNGYTMSLQLSRKLE